LGLVWQPCAHPALDCVITIKPAAAQSIETALARTVLFTWRALLR